MKKIMITGGAGFIGSNLCCYLISNFPDTYVICIDNMITGSIDNIRELLFPPHPRFKLIIHDINDVLDNEKVDEWDDPSEVAAVMVGMIEYNRYLKDIYKVDLKEEF